MEAAQRQIKFCLEVYRKRGEEALDLFARGELDRALECLKWRKAAYLNFRFYDQQAVKFDSDYLLQEEFQDLWQRLGELDRKLTEVMQGAGNNLAAQLQRIRQHRLSIRRYHSGSSQGGAFRKTV